MRRQRSTFLPEKRVVAALLDCTIPERNFGYAVRVPKGSGLSQFSLLKQALEAALGFTTHGTRETREQEVLVLKHVGPALPAKAAGNPALGSRLMARRNASGGEGASLSFLATWIEGQVKKPVFDETGLSDKYDWKIQVKSLELADLNNALKEIGLTLSPERRKIEYIVVRRIDDPH